MKKFFLPIIIIYYLFLYWYSINFLSFSIFEVESIEKFRILKFLFNFIHSEYTLRLIPLLISFFSLILYFKISETYLEKYKYFSTIIFIFIPGFIISSIIFNKAIFLIFFTLLFIYTFKKFRLISYLLLISYVFIDYSFVALYFSLIFYSIYKKDTKLLIFTLTLLTINANYFNYKIGGKPKGYLVEVIAVYMLIFSPFVFLYFVYTIYKGFFVKKDILFFIGSFTFLISIFLSFRQKIKIDDFAPFVLPYTIYMCKIFISSYKVRLRKFRMPYKILFSFLFSTMILFDILIFTNASKTQFNGGSFFIKPLSKILKKENINYIYCNKDSLCKALNFYGIKTGNKYFLNYSKSKHKVSIFYNNEKIKTINVSKLNTFFK